ncbi:hypothetical protein ARALYDRAFT_358051 [Arabidopsis lyrata subsp. lyrata]|uniref:Uncharacterized protein n=1 Tax=Arabidopsis lyrata subsp. lyrata TaxID=81972 RepID=D7MPN6_ARALL|nr:hypothetical protein ARALYDRAFT_358051 [Arabidopsis lyrata subsp. lyrata]
MLLKTEGAGGDESRGEREDVNGIDRENATDGDGMECLENDGIDNVNAAEEEHTMSAQEQEHEQSLDKGDKMVARELEDYLLEIQRHIDPSIRRGEEPNTAINHSVDVTPQPTRVNRTGTRGQDHNEATDNVNEKGSDSQRTWSGRVRPRLPTPVTLNVSPLKKDGLAKPHVRRPKKFWTPEEVEALREGVKRVCKHSLPSPVLYYQYSLVIYLGPH